MPASTSNSQPMPTLRKAVTAFNKRPIDDGDTRKLLHEMHFTLATRALGKKDRSQRIDEEQKYFGQAFSADLSDRDLKYISAQAEAYVPIPISAPPGQPEDETYGDLLDLLCSVLYQQGQQFRAEALQEPDTDKISDHSRRLLEHYVRWRKMRHHLHMIETNETLPLEHREIALRDLKKLPKYIEKTCKLLEKHVDFLVNKKDTHDQVETQALLSGLSHMKGAFEDVNRTLSNANSGPAR